MSNKEDDNKLETPGISELIKLLLKVFVFTLLLMIFNLLILPSIKDKIFPNIPPTVVWRSVFVTIYEIMKAIFHYITIFIIIVWVVYKFVERFIPNIPFPPIPLKDIVLGFPPFKEFKEIGIIDLLDGIVDTIISIDTPLFGKITKLGNTIGNFVNNQVSAIADDLRNLLKIVNQETYPNFNFEECIKDEVNRKCRADLGSNPITMPVKLLKYAMCRFIYLVKGRTNANCAYKKCINENIKPIYDTDSLTTKARKRVLNMKGNIQCAMKRSIGGAGEGVVEEIAKKAFEPFDKLSVSIDGIIPEIIRFPFKYIFDAVLQPFKLAFDAGDTGSAQARQLSPNEASKAFIDIAKELPPVKTIKEGVKTVTKPLKDISDFTILGIPIGSIVAAPINLVFDGLDKVFSPIGGLYNEDKPSIGSSSEPSIGDVPQIKELKEGIKKVKEPINAIKNFSIDLGLFSVPIGGIVAAPLDAVLSGIDKAFEPVGGL